MFNKRLYIVCLLIATVLILGACNKKDEQKVVGFSATAVQTGIPTPTVIETSKPTNDSFETVVEALIPTNDSSNTVVKSLRPTPGEVDFDLFKKDTSMFHFVVLDSISTQGNAALPALAFSNNYINIITGEKKQGLNEKYFREYYKSNNIYKVDDVSKLVNFKKMETVMYDEIMKSPEKYFVNNKAGFKFEKMDVLVIVPPADGSPLKDGWIGVYRAENDQRKMVAGSF